MKVIKYGRFSCKESLLKGSFETVKKRFPKVNEFIVKGAYAQVKQDKIEKEKKKD